MTTEVAAPAVAQAVNGGAEHEKQQLVDSQFLHMPTLTTPSSTPSIIYVRRDQLVALPLQSTPTPTDEETPSEPPTLNTRFGNFPHSTLLNIPYGSQVRAAAQPVSRHKQKRKRDDATEGTENGDGPEENETKGFVHVLAPTPELWTASLPHRTQVVYTPDSSYVLHRLRVRPGDTIIEAGAGSGSFTHAATRAVYGGLGKGRVISYEFHELRAKRLREELRDHGIDKVVTLVDGDVCEDGFLFTKDESTNTAHTSKDGTDPNPNAIFLDLPAPHLAIPHIRPSSTHAIRLCTFSPCIEQVTKTHAALHRAYWTAVETVEVSHKKIEVHYSQQNTSLEPTTPSAQLEKLKELALARKRRILESNASGTDPDTLAALPPKVKKDRNAPPARPRKCTLQETLSLSVPVLSRAEPEIKTHTSYLTFATLPMKWGEEEEEAARARVEREKGEWTQEVDKGWKKDYENKLRQKEEKLRVQEKRREEKRVLKEARRGEVEVEAEDMGSAEE